MRNKLPIILFSFQCFVLIGESSEVSAQPALKSPIEDRFDLISTVLSNLSMQSLEQGIRYNNRFIGIGNTLRLFAGPRLTGPGYVAASFDGKSWDTIHTNQWGLHAIGAGPEGVAVAGDAGKIFYSRDLQTWQDGGSKKTNILHALAYGNGLWVAAGRQGTVLSSPNGLDWTDRSMTNFPIVTWYSAIYAAGRFVLVGYDKSGLSISSADGEHWEIGQFSDDVFSPGTPASPRGASTGFSSVAYGNGRFVAPGGKGRVHVSSDGINWTRSTKSDAEWSAQGITFTLGRFVVAAAEGVLSSIDGINWNLDKLFFPRSDYPSVSGVVHSGNQLLLFGYFSHPTTVGDYVGGIALAEGLRPVIDRVSRIDEDMFTLDFSGGTEARYAVEAAPSLTSPVWTRIGEALAVDGVGTFEDKSAGQFPQRYYRLVAPATVTIEGN